ncbi:MAG: TM0106 family RecB-like putative nuclease [Deltaproteobacteria bacterium]|nr:TM0106 family RecB-like putative nuclease [Deltaproteobacteria bacterium]
MRHSAGHSLQFSPSDLITFLSGEFAAWMERAYAERGRKDPSFPSPDDADPEMALVRDKGMQHEAAVLAKLELQHGPAVRFEHEKDGANTLAALQTGKRLIYQGRLDHGVWHGYPDFLVRTETPSRLGPWSYRPLDSKLARSAKPYFLIQLCAYAEYLEALQDTRPPQLGFVLGTGEERWFETDRSFYFYRHLRDTFLEIQEAFDPGAQPDPALERSWGRWETAAQKTLEERDDLRLVARITRSQIKRLRAAGIATMTALASSSPSPKGRGGQGVRISDDVLARLRRQARLQMESRGKAKPTFEPLPHETGKRIGLAMLPPASPGDVFFDLEGNPLAESGLEYLFGAITVEDGKPLFKDEWAHDAEQEKAAFERTVDWIHERLRTDPNMHVYHYANYEVAALQRLMGKYATRENAVDDLLRGDVFVDLYAVTKNGVAIGTRGYSLKDIEVLFSPARTALVTSAASSVVEYNNWLASGEPPDWRASPILKAIRDYNREDCENTWHLATWLRERQREAGIVYIPQPPPEAEQPDEPRPEDELAEAMLSNAQDDVTRLVAWLLGYHRREDKPMWWRYFDRLESPPEDLYDDADCIAYVTRTETPPVPVKKSQLVEYAFNPDQDTKVEAGDRVYLLFGSEVEKHKIESLDLDTGRLTIKFGPKRTIPDLCHIIPNEHVPSDPLREAVTRFGEHWASGDRDAYRAVDDLLHRRTPRLTDRAGGALLPDAATFPGDLIDLIRGLDRTTLCIQGPPGAGKTYNAAAVIVALASGGKRIGVASNSHKAINNLLTDVSNASRTLAKPLAIYKAGGEDDAADDPERRISQCDTKEVSGLLADGIVVGGSAWLFARPELDQCFDYLFIDEAGQVCLANAVAMGLSAKNIVLIGDQMQLSQPAQAVHPGRSGWSCLHYLLEGHATVPPDMGVLLPDTWRLHPDICRFISDTAYEGRLHPSPNTARRCIKLPPDAHVLSRGTGIILDEIEHEGNTQSSAEEANRIAEYVADLRRATVREDDGKEHGFDVAKDLLIVAPYNAQVRCLKERMNDPKIRIASVDKFQGQEATVVIVSMCASSLEETARGPAFLLNPNRLNVTLSRARCLAIVVASSKLVRTRPNSVEEMELFNLYCRLRYYARELETTPVLQG